MSERASAPVGAAAGRPERPWQEGQDGGVVAYQERVHASWATWLLGLVVTGTLGVAYGYALGALWGLVTFVLLQCLAGWLLVTTAPVVRVDDRVLRAGRARLPLAHVGAVQVLDAEASRRLRGVDANPYAYHCIRSSVPGAVMVEVRDATDPHPYWLVSARDPQAVAAALRKMAG